MLVQELTDAADFVCLVNAGAFGKVQVVLHSSLHEKDKLRERTPDKP
jgi:hypothetical protein